MEKIIFFLIFSNSIRLHLPIRVPVGAAAVPGIAAAVPGIAAAVPVAVGVPAGVVAVATRIVPRGFLEGCPVMVVGFVILGVFVRDIDALMGGIPVIGLFVIVIP